MFPRSRFLPTLAVLLLASACSDASQPMAPDTELDVPEPQFWAGDGGAEVNTSIQVSPIACSETGVVTVNIQGVTPPPEESPIDVMLVLDESGSVDSNELAQVAQAARALLESLDQADGVNDNQLTGTRVGVVKFSSSATLQVPLTSNYNAIYNAVGQRILNGGTNIGAGLQVARNHLNSNGAPGSARAVVLFSDGVTSNAPFGTNEATLLKNAGTTVFTVAVPGANIAYMQSLATSPTHFFNVANFAALEEAFEAIAGQITFPAATNLNFSADVPAGFTLVIGSASATKGLVAETPTGVLWLVPKLDDETVTLTYQIQHDFGAAPAGGVMTAVTNASLTLTTPKSGVPTTESYEDVTTEVTGCDVTAPVVSHVLSGAMGDNDWFVGDVSLAWTVTEPETPETVVTVGCEDQLIATDGDDYSFSCQATSVGGASDVVTVTFKRDATDPTVSYAGNAGLYDIADDVAVVCTTDDNLSGVASDDCADLTGGAWSFGLGVTSFSATAIDFAGNTFTAGGSFTVAASYDGLCSLVQAWVSHKGVANSLCVKIAAAQRADERGNTTARDGSLGAFINEVGAQDDKKVPTDKASLLVLFAQALMN